MVRFPFKVLPHLPPFRASVFQVMLLELVFVVGFRVVISIVQFPPQLHFFSGGWNHRFTALRSAVPRFSPECPSSSTVVGQDGALGRWVTRCHTNSLVTFLMYSCIHVFMEFHSPCVLKMCVNSLFCFLVLFSKKCFSTPGDGVKRLYYPGVFDGAVRVQEYYGKRARYQHAADEGTFCQKSYMPLEWTQQPNGDQMIYGIHLGQVVHEILGHRFLEPDFLEIAVLDPNRWRLFKKMDS